MSGKREKISARGGVSIKQRNPPYDRPGHTEDCLSVNENIQGISDFSVSMENDVLTVSFVVNTIYGDIEFKDQQIAKPTAA